MLPETVYQFGHRELAMNVHAATVGKPFVDEGIVLLTAVGVDVPAQIVSMAVQFHVGLPRGFVVTAVCGFVSRLRPLRFV